MRRATVRSGRTTGRRVASGSYLPPAASGRRQGRGGGIRAASRRSCGTGVPPVRRVPTPVGGTPSMSARAGRQVAHGSFRIVHDGRRGRPSAMQSNSSTNFAALIRDTEASLGIRYPASAERLLADLSAIVGTPKHNRILERARLLVTAADVAGVQGETGESLLIAWGLLPFMQEGQVQSTDVYAFNLDEMRGGHVVLWSVHTVAADWPTADGFLHWIHTFVPPDGR